MGGGKGWRARLRHAVGAVAVSVLAACGGGGGGGTDGGTPPPTAADVAPVLTVQPLDTATTAGVATRLRVAATGANLAYQWQRSTDGGATWADVAGATRPELDLAAPTLADDGTQYRAVVGSGTARVVSSTVTLSVSAAVTPPSISVQPAATTVVAGATARFAVTAAGTALAYQWQASVNGGASWADIAAATAPTLELVAVGRDRDGQRLRVVLRNSAGTLASEAVLLSVTAAPAAPAFTRQPAAVSVTAPGGASFSVEVVGEPSPALQWQRSTDGGATWSDIAGATGASYTTGATVPADNGARFRAVARNTTASVASEAALLQVAAAAAAPRFTTQPVAATVPVGQSVSFGAAATGTPTPAFQWQASTTPGGTVFGNINGATDATLSFSPTLADNGRRYRVVVSNSQGSVTSAEVALTVTPPPGPLDGKAWQPGLRLAGVNVGGPAAALMDDDGQVLLITQQYELLPDRTTLWASRLEAGAPGAAPRVLQAPSVVAVVPQFLVLGVRLARDWDGGAVLDWTRLVPCAAQPSDDCLRVEQRRLAPGATDWVALPSYELFNDPASVNASALLRDGVRGAGGDVAVATGLGLELTYRRAGETEVRNLALPQVPLTLTSWQVLGIDALGRFVAAGITAPLLGGSADVLLVRGDLRSGSVGAIEALETRSSAAALVKVAPGTGGGGTVLWSQNNGTRDTLWAAELPSATADARIVDLNRAPVASNRAVLRPGPADSTVFWDLAACEQLTRGSGGSWSAAAAMPGDVCTALTPVGSGTSPVLAAFGPDATLLAVDTRGGSWLGFDAVGTRLVQPWPVSDRGPGWLLGVAAPASSLGTGLLVGNRRGQAVFFSGNFFASLPSPAQPAGDQGGATFFTWAFFFK